MSSSKLTGKKIQIFPWRVVLTQSKGRSSSLVFKVYANSVSNEATHVIRSAPQVARYLPPLTGNKEGNMELIVLRVGPHPGGQHTLVVRSALRLQCDADANASTKRR